jgi:hypothetical protein
LFCGQCGLPLAGPPAHCGLLPGPGASPSAAAALPRRAPVTISIAASFLVRPLTLLTPFLRVVEARNRIPSLQRLQADRLWAPWRGGRPTDRGQEVGPYRVPRRHRPQSAGRLHTSAAKAASPPPVHGASVKSPHQELDQRQQWRARKLLPQYGGPAVLSSSPRQEVTGALLVIGVPTVLRERNLLPICRQKSRGTDPDA